MTLNGRPAETTATHIARGTLRPDRGGGTRGDTGAAAVALPEPPEWLDEVGKAEWARMGEEMIAAGIVTRLDRAALALYAVAWQRFVRAEARMMELEAAGSATIQRLRDELGLIQRRMKRNHRPATPAEAERMERIEREIESGIHDPELALTPNGMAVLSAWSIERDRAWVRVLKAAAALGGTPTTRARAARATGDAETPREDEVADFMARKRA